MIKRGFMIFAKASAFTAMVVFGLMPVRTFDEMLICVGASAFAIICITILAHSDDKTGDATIPRNQ